MWCNFPPPLTDDQLSAVLDGVADAEVTTHLAACAGCARQLAEARQIEAGLHKQLYRWECPAPLRLGEYALGLLDPPEKTMVQKHLNICALCVTEVEEAKIFLASEPAADRSMLERLARALPSLPRLPANALIAKLTPPTPGLAYRGSAAGQILAQADGTHIVLDMQPDATGLISLIGQLVVEDVAPWTGALVELYPASAPRAISTVDDLGGFSFTGVPTGASAVHIIPAQGPALVLPAVDLIAS
jgi:hypothetical protein